MDRLSCRRRGADGGGRLRTNPIALPGVLAVLWMLALLSACGGKDAPPASDADARAARDPSITISGDEAAVVPAWQPPPVEVVADQVDAIRAEAEAALAAGKLHGGPRDAMPLLLALRRQAPDDARVQAVLRRGARRADRAGRCRAGASRTTIRWRCGARTNTARSRVPRPPMIRPCSAFLSRLDRADEVQALNRRGERELRAGRLGRSGRAARSRCSAKPSACVRATRAAAQGVAAVESAMLRRAEEAAGKDEFDAAERWLGLASAVRPGMATSEHARARIAAVRARARRRPARPRPGGAAPRRRPARRTPPAVGDVAHRRTRRSGRGRTAPAHRPGRALRPVPARPGVHRCLEAGRARAAAGGGAARWVPHGRRRG